MGGGSDLGNRSGQLLGPVPGCAPGENVGNAPLLPDERRRCPHVHRREAGHRCVVRPRAHDRDLFVRNGGGPRVRGGRGVLRAYELRHVEAGVYRAERLRCGASCADGPQGLLGRCRLRVVPDRERGGGRGEDRYVVHQLRAGPPQPLQRDRRQEFRTASLRYGRGMGGDARKDPDRDLRDEPGDILHGLAALHAAAERHHRAGLPLQCVQREDHAGSHVYRFLAVGHLPLAAPAARPPGAGSRQCDDRGPAQLL